jgi:hypothetical protein
MKVLPLSARIIPFVGMACRFDSTPVAGIGDRIIMAGQLHTTGEWPITPP